MFQANSYSLARKLESTNQVDSNTKITSSALTNAFLKNCDIKIIAKMCDIGKEIEESKNASPLDYLYRFINTIKNILKSFSSDNLNREDVKNIFTDITQQLKKSYIVEPTTEQKQLRTFTDRLINQEKSRNKITK